jgi:hypothetical protein
MADISNAIRDISIDLGLPLDKVWFDERLLIITAHSTTSQDDRSPRKTECKLTLMPIRAILPAIPMKISAPV